MSRPGHPIFKGPFPVHMDIAQTETPKNFHEYSLEPVPDSIPTVDLLVKQEPDPTVVQRLAKAQEEKDYETVMRLVYEQPPPGLVASGAGFDDSPDTEYISGGINMKGLDYVAIGRHGKFLQWGFWGSPDQMTEAGRAVLANAICYIAGFADAKVQVLASVRPRDSLAVTLALLERSEEAQRPGVLAREFGEDVPEAIKGNLETRRAWFADNRPYLRYVGGAHMGGRYAVDEDAKAWGLANFDVALLERCLEEWRAGGEADRAQRLLKRYTRREFKTVDEAASWFQAHRDRLFFSDSAGYRFMSLDEKPDLRSDFDQYRRQDGIVATMVARRSGDRVTALITAYVQGRHAYSPKASDGIPVNVRLLDGLALQGPMQFVPDPDDGHLTESFQIKLDLKGTPSIVEAVMGYQLCDDQTCLPPAEVKLACEVFSED